MSLPNVLLAYGINNTILKSVDNGATWAVKNQDASGNCILDIAWDGADTMVAVGGGGSGNSFFVSHDSGETWAPINVGGLALQFGFGGFDVYATKGQLIFWDSVVGEFMVVGKNTGSNLPTVGASADGDTWVFTDVAGQAGGQFLCVAKGNGVYVAVCWFGGIGGSAASQIFSSTNRVAWTSRFTSGGVGDRQYPWIGYSGANFLILSVAGNGNSIYSSDGTTFHETADSVSPNLPAFYGIDKAGFWDSTTGKWIVSSLGPLSPNGGIFTAVDPPATFATAYANPHAVNAYAGSVVRLGLKLVAFMGGAPAGISPVDPHLESTDGGATWVPVGPALDSQYFSVVANGTRLIGLRVDAAGNNDNFIAFSDDSGSTWSNAYDDANANVLNIAAFFQQIVPVLPKGANEMLGLQIGVGFHRFATIPGSGELRSIKEVQDPISGKLAILASDLNGRIWQLVPRYVSGEISLSAPVATTQQLPTPEQVGVELRDTQKVFKYLWVEGTNLADYIINWSIDGGATFLPPVGQALKQGLNRVGQTGTQIIFKFTRVSDVVRYSLMSYYKLFWDVQGKAAQ